MECWKDGTAKRRNNGRMERRNRMEEWNDGILEYMECWNDEYWVKNILKNLKLYETNRVWSGKISIEDLKGFGCGKMQFPFTSWPVKSSLTFPSSSRKLLETVSMLLIASQGIFQKVIAAVVSKNT